MASRKQTNYIVVHCSATSNKADIGAKEIDRWHRAKGFLKIGYHYVIRRDGTVETGRAEEEIGAHVLDYNAVSLGICMVGGVDADNINKAVNNFTNAQFVALAKLLRELKVRYPNAEILGHRDFPNVKKACPSFDVKDWLDRNGNE